MSMDYVRKTYGVDVKRGQRVAFGSVLAGMRLGTITGASHYLRIRFDGERRIFKIHPTDPWLNLSPEPDQ